MARPGADGRRRARGVARRRAGARSGAAPSSGRRRAASRWPGSRSSPSSASCVFGPTVADRVLFGNDGGRISYWTAAIRMFTDAPVTGVGPGMWAPQRIFHTAEGELDFYIPHAHNVYLQTAADSGLIGLVAGVVVFVLVARLVWASLRGDDPARAALGGRRRPRGGLLRRPPAVRRVREHAGGDLRVRVPHRLARRGRRRSRAAGAAGRSRPVPAMPCWRSARWRSRSRWAGGWRASDRRSQLDEAKTALGAGDAAAAAALAADAVAIDPSIPPGQLVLALAAAQAGDMRRSSVPRSRPSSARTGCQPPGSTWRGSCRRPATRRAPRRRSARALRLGQQQAALTLAAGADRTSGSATSRRPTTGTRQRSTQLPRLAADPYWHDPARQDRWAGHRGRGGRPACRRRAG